MKTSKGSMVKIMKDIRGYEMARWWKTSDAQWSRWWWHQSVSWLRWWRNQTIDDQDDEKQQKVQRYDQDNEEGIMIEMMKDIRV